MVQVVVGMVEDLERGRVEGGAQGVVVVLESVSMMLEKGLGWRHLV